MIVVVGESLVDVVDDPQDPRETVGGSPLNGACTLAGLDVPTMLITFGARVSGTWIWTWRSIEKVNASLLLASIAESRASRLWASLDAWDQLSVRIDVGTISAS